MAQIPRRRLPVRAIYLGWRGGYSATRRRPEDDCAEAFGERQPGKIPIGADISQAKMSGALSKLATTGRMPFDVSYDSYTSRWGDMAIF